MASPAEEVAAVAAAAAAAAAETKGKKEEKGKGGGMLATIWRALFGGRGEDYEKRLQYLSKEEAAVHARMRRRALFYRRGVRNLVALSALAEVGAVAYAIIVTKYEHLDWQMKAIRLLPMFVLPALSSMIYSILLSFKRILEQKDQKSLERLRTERKAKIDELKERSNYYLMQQLIQKYDLDPAAKAAAASVLAYKLGAETGLKVYVGDEEQSDSAQARSSDVEVVSSNGLRNRKQTNPKGSSTGSTAVAHNTGQVVSNEAVGADSLEAMHPPRVVGHYQGSGAKDSGWIAKIAAMLVGEDPSQSYALICGNCHMHNGLAKKEDFAHITYYCPHCHVLNMSNKSIGQCSDSNGGQLTSTATGGVSATIPVSKSELISNLTKVLEVAKEEIPGKLEQPVETN